MHRIPAFSLPSAPRAAILCPALTLFAAIAVASVLIALPAPAAAQRDPANVDRGNYDRARIGRQPSRAAPPRQTAPPTPTRDVFQFPQEDKPKATPATALELQALLNRVSDKVSTSGRYVGYGQSREFDAIRRDAQKLADQSWDRLSPQTQQLYRNAVKQAELAVALDERQIYRNFDGRNSAAAEIRSMRESREAMQQMREALLPMMMDVKRSFDVELRNAAARQR
jgi:hypothetical protein